MRDGWRETTLGEVATQHIDGFLLSPDAEYTNLGVQWYAQGTFARKPKRGSDMKATRLFRVLPGQFVYNRMFVTEGSFALIGPEHGHGVVSNEFPLFGLDQTRILPEFLLAYFQQQHVWRAVADEATGTTKSRRRWKESQFLAHRIALPPLDEQRRIVDLIAAVDDAVEAAEEEAATVIALLHAALHVHLEDSAGLRALSEIALQPRGLVGGPFGSSLVSADYREGGVPVIRGTNMPGSLEEHVSGAFAYVDPSKADSLSGNLALAGDVIFTQRGTIGQVGIVPDGVHQRYVVSQSQMRLRVDPTVATADYVRFVFTAPAMVSALRAQDRATANPHINLGVLAKTAIPVPGLSAQDTLVGDWMSLQHSGQSARTTADALRALRSNLLTLLLSGEHEIPSSYDALLEEVA